MVQGEHQKNNVEGRILERQLLSGALTEVMVVLIEANNVRTEGVNPAPFLEHFSDAHRSATTIEHNFICRDKFGQAIRNPPGAIIGKPVKQPIWNQTSLPRAVLE